jgi:hypothetical protein
MKKQIVLLVLLIACLKLSAQTYNIGASNAMGNDFRMDNTLKMQIIITDTSVMMGAPGQFTKYIRLKSTNPSPVYASDGVMIHTFLIVKKIGEVKGFNYDTYIMFHPDYRSISKERLIYYANEEK